MRSASDTHSGWFSPQPSILPQEGAAPALRKNVESEARDLSVEAFVGLMDYQITLLESNNKVDTLDSALRVMDKFIDASLGESASNVAKFFGYLHTVLESKRNPEVLSFASKVLGHLAKARGAMAADEVECQVKTALSWLRGDRVEHHRLAAVLVLKETAENASTVFNIHVREFGETIWAALRDLNLEIRERAVEALRACLRVIEKRETRWRIHWCYRMFEAAQDGLVKTAPFHSIHGSLLAVGELLRNSSEFMMPRYREVVNIVMNYVDHSDRLVRLSITSLLPRIAHFSMGIFVTSHSKIIMKHFLAVLSNPAERASGFIALGEMAGVLDEELVTHLPTITSHLHDAIAPRKGKQSLEALICVGNLARALRSKMEYCVRDLLDAMFSAGLSSQLVETLEQVTTCIPSLLPTVQDLLLECISPVLSRSSHNKPKASMSASRGNVLAHARQFSEGSVPAPVQLALQTLGRFNLKGQALLEFARESVVKYLEDEDAITRKEAALCCCQLIPNSFAATIPPQFSSNRSNRVSGKKRILIEEIVQKLLVAAVADADVFVRRSIFSSLHTNGGLDDFLAQADSLSAIFASLNDEDFEVREYAILLAGKLSERNPAYVLPALRRHLMQLLTYLDKSPDTKCREESAQLLGCLIRSCERLILPYIAPIHKVLVAKLSEGAGVAANNGIITGVLVTVGDLARVGGPLMRKNIPELMPLIVDALLDGAALAKCEVAVVTLGQVVESTGYVVVPYNEYPQLLGLLLKMLNGELPWSTRREVLKVIGLMGALDPHMHKRNQQSLSDSHGDVARAGNDASQLVRSIDGFPSDLWPSFATTEDYFSTVALSSLMRILRDPSLSSYHQTVVGSLVFIFKSMGLSCVTYLPKVLPDLLHIVRTCDDALKEFITWKLGTLVSIVQRHISRYLPDLLSLISELWSSFCLPAPNRTVRGMPVLHLVEHLCVALNDEFRTYLPSILPCCIQVLADAEQYKDYTYVPDILHTLEVFGGTLDEHMHLLVPALIRLLKVNADVSVKQVISGVSVKRDIIKTLTRLIPRVQVTGHISTLVHHLKLVLEGKSDELRKDAVNALCCLAYARGEDFNIFVPSIHKLLLKHNIRHKEFQEIEGRLKRHEPLISSTVGLKKLTRHLPVDPISDPLDDLENDSYDDGSDAPKKLKGQQVNDGRLHTAGEASQLSTKEDWAEWMRHFSIELLRESPFPALRTCAKLAQLQPSVGRELFAAGFVSCWAQLNENSREQLVWSVKMALFSPNIPSEILATLLNLAELMEHEENPLPIDIRLLGALTDKCRAFAKSLHYKEMEFEGVRCIKTDGNPVILVEALIHINNQLQQDEAAVGILTYAQQHLGAQLKESWYEKLERWDDALRAYTAKASQSSNANILMDATLGRMRCLDALGRWEELSIICKEYWASAETAARLEMAPMAASAAWNMGEWDQMAEYVSILDDGDETKLRTGASSSSHGSNGTFFRAILMVHNGQYDEAREYIEKARKCLASELAALVLESYDRAYSNMVRVQQLTELEEVISYCTLPMGNPVAEAKRALIRSLWTDRLQGAKRNVKVWQVLLGVRTLVLHPTEDVETWLKFASLCRNNGRIPQSRSTLVKLLQYDPESSAEKITYRGPPQVMYAYLKCQWSLGDEARRKEAFMRLEELCMELSSAHNLQSMSTANVKGVSSSGIPLLARVHLKLGSWKWALFPGLEDECAQDIRNSFRNATQCASKWAKAWHHWALFNTAVMSHYTLKEFADAAHQFVVAAVTGYFHSIACGANVKGGDDNLQDILRLLTLWFNHGATADVQMALQKGFSHVNINTWLVVLPQIIARIHSNNHAVRELIQSLLVRVGQTHPQALMYPLLVACKSISNLRRAAAQEVVDKVRQHSGVLVDQAQLVSTELIRVAILWHEMWHEALEEASRLYFGEHNIEGMLKVLEPLHTMLEEGARRSDITIKENAFIQAYHHELLEAYDCCMNYKRTGKDAELTQAWDLYYHVFRRIDKQLQSLTTLDLQSVSPALLDCRDLQLAVPGTYRADSPVVTIASFATQLEVIPSKQRPRKLTIYGSNGESYTFLLKGHEDLRQDERVMQLFGLVNTLLENSRKTAEKDLSIQRYSVIPLSPNSGLIGWVPNCDTLHHLIREYRDARKIILNQELKYILSFAPDYDRLPLIAKVEVFECALQNTDGNDLARIFWLKSRTSEVWLDRRTNYTRSLAVMSMVGYLLGLGDRHPSNLMLHRYSGKILHIDFGDCFEASMNREKFPEKVPFRLTRMLVKAMEASGIEGNFRMTCENVMHVLRAHKDSVMAMMEAFVHDPLINWRLFNFNEVPQMATFMSANLALVNGEETCRNGELPHPQRGARERELLQAVNQLGDANGVLNERAVVVMARMSNKLTGRDFSSGISAPASPMHHGVERNNLITGDTRETDHSLSVKLQVQKLINQATSHENLCQNYVGWCPFW